MRFVKPLLLSAAILTLAPVGLAQQASTPYTCFPTCSEFDGRMLSLAGSGLRTVGGDFINVSLVSDGDGFELGIFDGDTGTGATPNWDRVPPAELGLTQLRYQLFADPDGTATGMTEVGVPGGWLSNLVNPSKGPSFVSRVDGVETGVMANNNWFDIDMQDIAAAAATPGGDCPEGKFCYRLLVTLTNPVGETESNFKLRTTGEISLRPIAFSFVGALRSLNDAPIIYPRFPDTSVTTYDGTWRFLLRFDEPSSFLFIWGGDFDYGSWDCVDLDTNDPDTCMNSEPACVPNSNPDPNFKGKLVPPWADGTFANSEGVAKDAFPPFTPSCRTGAPADDQNPNLMPFPNFFTRSPSVRYTLETPFGSFPNDNPSGNQEWEQFRLETDTDEPADFYVDDLPLADDGGYSINYEGLDLANLNALRVSVDIVGIPSASIGDRVWLDTLRPEDGGTEGVQDPGEIGINGVTVRLYRDSNDSGVLDAGDELVATQVTSGDGDYDFLGLGAANYFVDVDETTLPPLGLTLTTNNDPYPNGGAYPLEESEDHDDADFGYKYDCADCDGKISAMTLRFLGSETAFVEVFQRKGQLVFSGDVDPFGEFTFFGVDKKGTLGPAIEVFVDGSKDADFHTSCSVPIGPGSSDGRFLVTAASSRNNELTCTVPGGGDGGDPPGGCSECSGKVTQLSMRYDGMAPVFVEVEQKKGRDIVFAALVMPGEVFTFSGTDKKGTLSTEITIFVDNGEHASLHTSCSVPIGPGTVAGDFTVVEGFSRNGGQLCPLP